MRDDTPLVFGNVIVEEANSSHKAKIAAARRLLIRLTLEQRLDVFREFCLHCGVIQPSNPRRQCQCWNDE